MTELFAKIDAEPTRRAAPSLNLGARMADFFELAVAAHAGVVGERRGARDRAAGRRDRRHRAQGAGPGYQTASVSAAASRRRHRFALIRFQPQATAGRLTRFLETNKLSIADGPAAGGMYRVRIAETKLSKAELDRVLQELQSDKIVGVHRPDRMS